MTLGLTLKIQHNGNSYSFQLLPPGLLSQLLSHHPHGPHNLSDEIKVSNRYRTHFEVDSRGLGLNVGQKCVCGAEVAMAEVAEEGAAGLEVCFLAL